MAATFDQETGQVFKEWVLSRDSLTEADRDAADWSRRRRYPAVTARGVRGPRSLANMVIKVVADNIGSVGSVADLEDLPTRLLWRIWRFLEARGECLHAWKLFSKLFLEAEDDKTLSLYRFRQHICRPGNDLTRYTVPLTAPPTDFITHLVLTGGCSFNTHDLLCLADMPNLGALELIQPADELRTIFPQVSDRLVRGWTEKSDPFPLLRILRIWGDQSTTKKSLQWVSQFPSLALYDVMGAREDWKQSEEAALEHGWEQAPKVSGLEDSLLRYLMLFAPLEETRTHRLSDLAARIDNDLVSLCGDSRCAVKFVQDRQAPPLLDYLTDMAKVRTPSWDTHAASSEARACHGVAFEPWAFWLYSFLGQLSSDRDLHARGALPPQKAVAGPFILPSRPFACLHLGHSTRGSGINTRPSYVSRGLFATGQYTFTRDSVIRGDNPKPKPIPKKGPSLVASERAAPVLALRKHKKRRLEDVLQAMSK
ncbi:hypothetical protein NW754_006960 [Fusarium falciforme]|nr:hypothetical protein NW754_006960 [Fusarium falciforme]KAJ4209455.1 hypothetical protein NW767_001365 [Fusarium falciforme]KAJ4262763.1 hypothetical protein NW757_001020 [Fusarium falciforme]